MLREREGGSKSGARLVLMLEEATSGRLIFVPDTDSAATGGKSRKYLNRKGVCLAYCLEVLLIRKFSGAFVQLRRALYVIVVVSVNVCIFKSRMCRFLRMCDLYVYSYLHKLFI